MGTHWEVCKEKLDVAYTLFGIGADVNQLARAYIRGESKGVKRNVKQIIAKLDKIHKRL
jgi:hypothetical protein